MESHDQHDSRGLSAARPAPGWGGRPLLLLDAGAILFLALLTRIVGIGHTVFIDELNHVLAARSYVEGGTLAIAGGIPYERAALFTRIVAWMFRLFGESLVVARIPALAAGVALVLLVFFWVRSFAGRPAAWAAGLLVCFSPGAIYLSQLCRFYSMQVLFFLAGTICVARLAAGKLRPLEAVAAGISALLFFALAYHLQITSIAGIAGVALWVGLVSPPALARFARSGRLRLVGGALAAAAMVVFGLWAWKHVSGYRAYFDFMDPWAPENKGSFRYYHWFFLDLYPTLWTLFPALALLALGKRARESSLAFVVFTVALVIQSLATWKSERYIAYAMPFFFTVAGVGLAEAVPWLHERFAWALGALRRGEPVPRAAARAASVAVVLVVLLAVAGNGAFPMALKMLVVDDSAWPYTRLYRGEPDWEAASERLRPLLTRETVLLGPSDLKFIFYFHHLDYILSRAMLSEPGEFLPEFTPSPKTGVPVISEAGSLRKVIRAGRPGLAIVEAKHMRTPWIVPSETAAVLERETEEIALPPEWKLRAFRWGSSPGGASDPGR